MSNPPGPGFLNIPLGLIETLEQRDLFFVQIYCKDGRCYRIQFNNTTSCDDWLRRIMNEIAPPGKIEDLFSFSHFAWACEEAFEELSSNLSNAEMSGDFTWFRSELARLRFDLQAKIKNGNSGLSVMVFLLIVGRGNMTMKLLLWLKEPNYLKIPLTILARMQFLRIIKKMKMLLI